MKSVITIRNLLARFSSLFTILSALAAGTFGQAVLVSDANTSLTSANGNFGKLQTVTVSPKNTAYVKFEIAATLPAGTKADDIAKAVARFYVSKVTTAGKLDVLIDHGRVGRDDHYSEQRTAGRAACVGDSTDRNTIAG